MAQGVPLPILSNCKTGHKHTHTDSRTRTLTY